MFALMRDRGRVMLKWVENASSNSRQEMWVLTTQPSFEMKTRAMFGRLKAFDVKHDGLLASGRSRRSLRSVEESFSDFDDPSSQPGNSPSRSMLRRDLQLTIVPNGGRQIKFPKPNQACG